MFQKTPSYRRLGKVMLLVVAAAAWAAAGPAHDHGEQGNRHPANWASIDRMHLYLCAFHVAKENPRFQVIAHHYCAPQAGDLHQCVIYDNRGPSSKLIGVEYIIGDETYQTLPAEEKKYWHPHAYEILSGQLVAPDQSDQGDQLLSGLMMTWGKTWHTWRDPSSRLPLGEPLLMWSANGDDQIDSGLLSARDAEFGLSTEKIRDRRKTMGYLVPQVPMPKSIQEIGRRWTPAGPDTPTKTDGKGK